MKEVLITGGSSGIGFELARKFAADRYEILLASSNGKKLQAAKERLEKEFKAKVTIYVINLAELGAAERLYRRIKADGFSPEVLVNNAGIGAVGAAEKIDMKKEEQMMILNMITPVKLTKLFLADMYRNGAGKILNVSSVGAFQPGPYTASYYAGKEFLLSYSRAVRYEAGKRNVWVCTLCPGTTDTDFFKRAGVSVPKYAMPPGKAADYAYRRLFKNKELSIPGLSFRLMRLFPVKVKIKAVAAAKRPRWRNRLKSL